MSKEKRLGAGLENRVVEWARKRGLFAEKQPLSGALKRHPGDVLLEDGVVECKVRTPELHVDGTRYITLDLNWFDKIRAEAKKLRLAWGVVVLNETRGREPMVLCSLAHYLDLHAALRGRDYQNLNQTGEEEVKNPGSEV